MKGLDFILLKIDIAACLETFLEAQHDQARPVDGVPYIPVLLEGDCEASAWLSWCEARGKQELSQIEVLDIAAVSTFTRPEALALLAVREVKSDFELLYQ